MGNKQLQWMQRESHENLQRRKDEGNERSECVKLTSSSNNTQQITIVININ